jgi:isoquinoline 1-oxidoreductase subunit beta
MNHMPRLNRRAFVVGTAAVGTGLALGFDIPFGGPNVVGGGGGGGGSEKRSGSLPQCGARR